jgi:importin subunit alpha-1
VVVDGGALPHLTRLIAHANRDVRKEACWTLSNIAAGTVRQIQAILDAEVMPAIIAIANSSVARETEVDVWTEACWVVLNASSCGSDTQIHYLVKHG